MKLVLRALCLLALMLNTQAFGAPTMTDTLDAVVAPYVNDKQFMGTVLVAQGEQILLHKAYGFANLEWNIPMDTQTKFRLGSLTKQFTAASILLLEQQGKLHTDDLLKKHWPEIPSSWDKIKIFHLLTHSSGIPEFTRAADFEQIERMPGSIEQTLRLVRNLPLEFPPGEKMSYSNSGYIILGGLIEKLSGKSYASFVQDTIFTPLNMAGSGYDNSEEIIHRRAAGYEREDSGRVVNTFYIDMATPFAAGGLYSTCEDLLRWQRTLFEQKFLSKASLHKMLSVYKDSAAMGLFISHDNKSTNGKKSKNSNQSTTPAAKIFHAGTIPGFATYMSYQPSKRITVIVLANIVTGKQTALAERLEQLVLH